ncbi:hypothetical protein PLESTB_001708200 [Pleodorina starrii]|uniref:U-box domain-containing protein n=1 Tax=Pleodorina starrii TaxID=330485 RepID=A0A9W6BZB9_9CHLO|nr:hypothetical protein PLESTB_001708200 [Pleodorina starrii]GLC76610.1 hypothetical protein PLESTF_001804800 [Pleodorina starrii]
MESHVPKRARSERRYLLFSSVNKVPSEYICPLSWRIMDDPVLDPDAHDGRAMERDAFEEHQRTYGVRPLTGLPAIPSSRVRTMVNLQRVISHFLSGVEDTSQQQPLHKRSRLDEPAVSLPCPLSTSGQPQAGVTAPTLRPALNLAAECEVPAPFFCPLSRCVMSDPVVDRRDPGASMERAAAEAHVAQYGTNPFTGEPMATSDLVPDKGLWNAINRWLAKHSGTHELRLHIRPVAAHNNYTDASPNSGGDTATTAAAAKAAPGLVTVQEPAGPDQVQHSVASTETAAAVTHAGVPSHASAEAHRTAASMGSAGGTGVSGNGGSASGAGGNAAGGGSGAGIARAAGSRGTGSSSGAGDSSSGSSGTSGIGTDDEGCGTGAAAGAVGGGHGGVGAVWNAATGCDPSTVHHQLQPGVMAAGRSESNRSSGDRLPMDAAEWASGAGGGSSDQQQTGRGPTAAEDAQQQATAAPAVFAAAEATADDGGGGNPAVAALVTGRPYINETAGGSCLGRFPGHEGPGPGLDWPPPGLLERWPPTAREAAEAGTASDAAQQAVAAAEAVVAGAAGGRQASAAAAQAAALWAAAAPPGIAPVMHRKVPGDRWGMSYMQEGAGPQQTAGAAQAEAGREEGVHRRGKDRYTDEELEALVEGLEQCGFNSSCWAEIKATKPQLSKRTEIALLMKWRGLVRHAASGWTGRFSNRVQPSLMRRISRLLEQNDPDVVWGGRCQQQAAEVESSEPEAATDDDTQWHAAARGSNLGETRKQRYTDEELHVLLDSLLEYGYDWQKILEKNPIFHGRTESSVRQKWMSLRVWAERGWEGKPNGRGGPRAAMDVRAKVEAVLGSEAAAEVKAAGRVARYTEQEVEALVDGLSEFGWDVGAILDKWPVLRSRNETSLRLKWESLRVLAARGWATNKRGQEPPAEHVRRKIEALEDAERTRDDVSVPQRQLIGMSTQILVPDDIVLELLDARVLKAEVSVQVREEGFKTHSQIHAATLRSNLHNNRHRLVYCTSLRKVLCGKEITGWEVTPKKTLLVMIRVPTSGGDFDGDDDGDGSRSGEDDEEEGEEEVDDRG